jgi:hypothetical protein
MIILIISIFVLSSTVTANDIDDDTVLMLHFDEGDGNITYDSSPYGNNGYIFGATWTTGISGSALMFDGYNDYIEIPDSSSLNPENITIDFWVKFIEFQGAGIISKGGRNGWYIADRSGEHSILVSFKGDVNYFEFMSPELYTNIWYHVLISNDGSFLRLFINDKEVGFLIVNRQPFGSGSINIGVFPNLPPYFRGVVDEVKIKRTASLSKLEQQMQEHESRIGAIEVLVNSLSDSFNTLTSAFNSFVSKIISYLGGLPPRFHPMMICNYMQENNLTIHEEFGLTCQINNSTCNCVSEIQI